MNIARIKRRRRILFLLLGFSALSISGTLILLATRDSIIYFYSPTELLNKNNIDILEINNGHNTLRVAAITRQFTYRTPS